MYARGTTHSDTDMAHKKQVKKKVQRCLMTLCFTYKSSHVQLHSEWSRSNLSEGISAFYLNSSVFPKAKDKSGTRFISAVSSTEQKYDPIQQQIQYIH